MVELPGRIRQGKRRSLQGQKIELQTFDGIVISLHLHLQLQSMLHLKMHISRQQPVCAEAVMMHGLPSNMRPSCRQSADGGSASTGRAAAVSTARISHCSQHLEPRHAKSTQSTWSNGFLLVSTVFPTGPQNCIFTKRFTLLRFVFKVCFAPPVVRGLGPRTAKSVVLTILRWRSDVDNFQSVFL